MMLLLSRLISVDCAGIVALANLKYNTLMSNNEVALSAYSICGRFRETPVFKALLKSRLMLLGFVMG